MVHEDSREMWKEAKALTTALSQAMKFPVRLTLLLGPAALWTLYTGKPLRFAEQENSSPHTRSWPPSDPLITASLSFRGLRAHILPLVSNSLLLKFVFQHHSFTFKEVVLISFSDPALG